MFGGAGNDTYLGEGGNDVFIDSRGRDKFLGGAGENQLDFSEAYKDSVGAGGAVVITVSQDHTGQLTLTLQGTSPSNNDLSAAADALRLLDQLLGEVLGRDGQVHALQGLVARDGARVGRQHGATGRAQPAAAEQ